MGLKYCGGCRSFYDRGETVKKILAQLPNSIRVEFTQQNETYDYVLVVCGCPTQCADITAFHSKAGIFSLSRAEDAGKAVKNICTVEASFRENAL